MRIIISHDVDILHSHDHWTDLLMVKRIVRNAIEVSLGYTRASNFWRRFADICTGRVNNLESLIAYDKCNNIPSTFFFGMSNGNYLNYSLRDAARWIDKVQSEGLSVGVHGIECANRHDIESEYERFRDISRQMKFGVRMHYLRRDASTLNKLAETGYVFDSSVYKLAPPYKIGPMWEFPLHIMDSALFSQGHGWMNQSLYQAKVTTRQMLADAKRQGIEYFTVLLHDVYFTPSYQNVYDWYKWLVDYTKENGIEVVSYQEAISHLSGR